MKTARFTKDQDNFTGQKGVSAVITILLVLAAIGGTAYFFIAQQPGLLNNSQQTTPQAAPESSYSFGDEFGFPSRQTAATYQSSDITLLDDTWSLYKNNEYGYSIRFPTNYQDSFADCVWNADQNSYRPESGPVEAKIVETVDKSIAYISKNFIYYLTDGEEQEGVTNYKGCDEIETTAEVLQEPNQLRGYGWVISAYKMNSGDEIVNLIKNWHGTGCELGELTPTEQDGVYEVSVQYPGNPNDGLDVRMENGCAINYAYEIRYNSSTNVIVGWDLGQAASYYKNLSTGAAYDQDMVSSFEFTN